MPIHFFISENNEHIIPDRESATLSSSAWKTITWDAQAAELTFGDGEGKIFWKDVATAMGCTSQKPHDRFLLRTRFPIDALLAACNHFNLSPYQFLIDPNNDKEATVSAPKRISKREDIDITAINRKILNLESSVLELSKKYETLLQAHKELLQRINSYPTGINDLYSGIAAEDTKH